MTNPVEAALYVPERISVRHDYPASYQPDDRRRHQPASGFCRFRTRFPAATNARMPSFRQGRIILRDRSQAHMNRCRSRRRCTVFGQGSGQLDCRLVLPDLGHGAFVNARCAVVRAHRQPRPPQDVFAVDLVLQRVKRLIRVGLDRYRACCHALTLSPPIAAHSRQRGRSTAGCAVRHTSYDLGKLRGKLLVDKPEREAALTRSTFTKSTANKPLS
jgi:hypothetical protein